MDRQDITKITLAKNIKCWILIIEYFSDMLDLTYEVVLGLEDKNSINIVFGSYLKENTTDRYKLLKQYLHGKN